MLKKIIDIRNWTRLEKTIEQKSNVLLSLFAMLGMITTAIQMVVDTVNELYIGVGIDSTLFAFLVIIYFMNEKGSHLPAKILFLSFLNIFLFLYASILPKEVGTYFFYFPIVAITSLIFESKHRLIRNVFITIPVLFVLILELSNYQLFGYINIQEGIEDNYSFKINIVVSMVVTIVAIFQMMTINRDIDDRRIKIAKELEQKNDDLEKSNSELDHFVYSTSHDLKAPLSSITGLINLAKLEIKDKKSLSYFDKINERISKLNSFIKDIIDLSRNSRLELSKQLVNLKEIVDNVIDNNRYMDNAKSIDFQVEISTDEIIEFDKARLEVILNNLISNAIKYHKRKGKRFVLISIAKKKSKLEIKVKDNGIGIEKTRQKKVFDMFYRAHDSSEGSGLGLYIVSDVVSKMNGNISLMSQTDIGTEIKLEIPLQL